MISPQQEEAMLRVGWFAWFPLKSLRAPSARELVALAALWHQRVRQRRQLARLDDGLLKDIGLTRCDAEMEAAKPFWRA
jgi:uncharacterized protein YjiS (DUF1127 family)